jgi:DNA-binding LytR/AlgR family response regulator
MRTEWQRPEGWIDDAGQLAAAEALVTHAERMRAAPAREPSANAHVQRIAVRSVHRIVIVQVDDVVRLEAEDN